MLRFLFLFLFLPATVPAYVQAQPATSAVASKTAPAIAIEERGGNVYLLGRGFHTAADTMGLSSTEKYTIVRAAPLYTGRVTFLFADGSSYEYIPKQALPNTSFAVLLKGEAELPESRRGIGKLFTRRQRVQGDAALLQWLQTRQLQSVRYEQEQVSYWNGKTVKTYGIARTYTSPTEFATMRSAVNKIPL